MRPASHAGCFLPVGHASNRISNQEGERERPPAPSPTSFLRPDPRFASTPAAFQYFLA
jgi:hypothetical protein